MKSVLGVDLGSSWRCIGSAVLSFNERGCDCRQALPSMGSGACAGEIRPRVINVDGNPAYPPVLADLKRAGELRRNCSCRPAPYLNNIIEQDHRFINKRIAASLWFRSVDGALNTIEGYEAMHMIRKGQIRWLPKCDTIGQFRFVNQNFGLAA